MKSLQSKSLLAHLRGKNLDEVLQICQSTETISGVCFDSFESFVDILRQTLGPRGDELLMMRGDLVTLEQLFEFAKGLSRGFSFKYALAIGNDDEEVISLGPFYNYHPRRNELLFDFSIEGLLPEAGTSMAMVAIRTDTTSNQAVFHSVEYAHHNPQLIINWIARTIVTNHLRRTQQDIDVIVEVAIDEFDLARRITFGWGHIPQTEQVIRELLLETRSDERIRAHEFIPDVTFLIEGRSNIYFISIYYASF